MKLQNGQVCSNCGKHNPLYDKNCCECKHYLRASVVNIDLWKTIWQLFESPQKALTNIIWAEHKNFISFMLAFLGLKLFLTSVIFQSSLKLIIPESEHYFYNMSLVAGIYVVTILLFTKLLTVGYSFKNKTRFKDNLSIIVYSFVPMILAFFILTPVEYGIFGKHWFIYNPSPFLIKSNLAYILVGIEVLMTIWSIVILLNGIYLQINSKILSVAATLLFYLVLILEIAFIPYILL
jgi:Yip1 domain